MDYNSLSQELEKRSFEELEYRAYKKMYRL